MFILPMHIFFLELRGLGGWRRGFGDFGDEVGGGGFGDAVDEDADEGDSEEDEEGEGEAVAGVWIGC